MHRRCVTCIFGRLLLCPGKMSHWSHWSHCSHTHTCNFFTLCSSFFKVLQSIFQRPVHRTSQEIPHILATCTYLHILAHTNTYLHILLRNMYKQKSSCTYFNLIRICWSQLISKLVRRYWVYKKSSNDRFHKCLLQWIIFFKTKL